MYTIFTELTNCFIIIRLRPSRDGPAQVQRAGVPLLGPHRGHLPPRPHSHNPRLNIPKLHLDEKHS